MATRPAVGLASQLLNAGTNVATAYIASASLAPADFGTFAVAFTAVTVVLAAGRGLVGATMLAHLPSASADERRALTRSAVGFTALVGAGATVVLLAGSVAQPALLWFAPWTAVVLLHDAGRYAFLAVGRQAAALLLDVVWAVVQGVALSAWWFTGGGLGVGAVASAWGAGALAGLAVFGLLARDHARPARPRHWVRTTRDVAGWFTALSVLGQLELYLVLLLTATLLSPADAGGLRAVQLLLAQPALVLTGALLGLAVPAFARAVGDPDALRRAWRRTALAVVPIGIAVLGVAALGEPAMELLFGQYAAYTGLVPAVALQAVAVSLVLPTTALLMGTRRGRLDVALHAGRTCAALVAVTAGAVVAGAPGVAWSLAASSAVVLVVVTVVGLRTLTAQPPDLALPDRRRTATGGCAR